MVQNHDLELDTAVRDWVFIPLMLSIVLMKLLTQYAHMEVGLFHQKPQSKSMQESMASDPSMMVDMMKKNLTGVVPQLAMGMVVNFFFNGFRGIDLTSLDVSYFTSLSFYILLLFGLRGVFSLVFRDDTVDETEMMRRQMNPMGNNMVFDADNAFKTERAALSTLDHEWELETAEEKAVDVLKGLGRC
ncbi:ER membrane protein complex subunit 3 [Haematococcus lacustris]|uniref:ER membrane protein complex subunit 3 n=1 Tax=Haematococcus lacustris TaxID=44745 RepID=A0A6A0AG64_HAELA|nr:ER membrane protein complex subunit 3 [Haematococcus lacustris]